MSLKDKYPFIEEIVFRDNAGWDIGAYDEGYQRLKRSGFKGDVIFVNSSVAGPHHSGWLVKYNHLFHRRADIGLCGISMNSHSFDIKSLQPHVQSFFLYTAMCVLGKVFPDHLPGIFAESKADVVTAGEIALSSKILENGYGICCDIFKSFIYFKGGRWKIPFGHMRVVLLADKVNSI